MFGNKVHRYNIVGRPILSFYVKIENANVVRVHTIVCYTYITLLCVSWHDMAIIKKILIQLTCNHFLRCFMINEFLRG